MELATAITTVKTVAKAAKTTEKIVKKMKELYDIDQRKRVVFNKDFFSGTFREKVMINGQERVVPDFRNDDFQIIDRRVTIFATGDRDPFCDASSFSPEKILTIDLLRASVTHDAIYQYQEDIAVAWGWPVEDVRELADHAHGNELQHEARKQTSAPMRLLGDVVAHVAHFCTRTFGGIYHRAHAGRNAVVAALVLCMAGCAEIPQVFDPSDEPMRYVVTNVAHRASAIEHLAQASATLESPVAQAEAEGGKAPSAGTDAVPFDQLQWLYGGFRGGNATLVAGCEIGSLKVSSSGMSYKWVKGGCEQLGASSRTAADCICALFVKGKDGQWRGGKFDWISTSRTTRSFENIKGEYHGWPSDAIETAAAYAFVITSKDGKRRSNVTVSAK
jgi:hypothetical protein